LDPPAESERFCSISSSLGFCDPGPCRASYLGTVPFCPQDLHFCTVVEFLQNFLQFLLQLLQLLILFLLILLLQLLLQLLLIQLLIALEEKLVLQAPPLLLVCLGVFQFCRPMFPSEPLGMCWCCTILPHSDLQDISSLSRHDICLTFHCRSSWCSLSTIPSLPRRPQLDSCWCYTVFLLS